MEPNEKQLKDINAKLKDQNKILSDKVGDPLKDQSGIVKDTKTAVDRVESSVKNVEASDIERANKFNDLADDLTKKFSSFNADQISNLTNFGAIVETATARTEKIQQESLTGISSTLTESFATSLSFVDRLAFRIHAKADQNIRKMNEAAAEFDDMQTNVGNFMQTRMLELSNQLLTADHKQAINIKNEMLALRKRSGVLHGHERDRMEAMHSAMADGMEEMTNSTSIFKQAIVDTLPTMDSLAEKMLGGGILGKFAGNLIRARKAKKQQQAATDIGIESAMQKDFVEDGVAKAKGADAIMGGDGELSEEEEETVRNEQLEILREISEQGLSLIEGNNDIEEAIVDGNKNEESRHKGDKLDKKEKRRERLRREKSRHGDLLKGGGKGITKKKSGMLGKIWGLLKGSFSKLLLGVGSLVTSMGGLALKMGGGMLSLGGKVGKLGLKMGSGLLALGGKLAPMLLKIAGPVALMAGAGILGFKAGNWLHDNLVGPWLEDYYDEQDKRKWDANNAVIKTTTQQAKVRDEETGELLPLYRVWDPKLQKELGKQIATEKEIMEAAKKTGHEGDFSQLMVPDSEGETAVGKAMATKTATGAQAYSAWGGGLTEDMSAGELEKVVSGETARDELSNLSSGGGRLHGKGKEGFEGQREAKRKQQILHTADQLQQAEKELVNYMSKPYDTEEEAEVASRKVKELLINTGKVFEVFRGHGKRKSLGGVPILKTSDYHKMKKAFPMMYDYSRGEYRPAMKKVDYDWEDPQSDAEKSFTGAKDNQFLLMMDHLWDEKQIVELLGEYDNAQSGSIAANWRGTSWERFGGGEAFMGERWSDPELPGEVRFAKGGLVRRPTRALIGENNKPEVVIPLSKSHEVMAKTIVKTASLQPTNQSGGILGNVHRLLGMEQSTITKPDHIENHLVNLQNQNQQLKEKTTLTQNTPEQLNNTNISSVNQSNTTMSLPPSPHYNESTLQSLREKRMRSTTI
jgi:SLT domain-containing protein